MAQRLCLVSLIAFVIAVAAVFSGGARAQGLSSNAEEPRAGEEVRGDTKVVVIDEIERGFYLAVDYGPNYYIHFNQPGFVPMNEPPEGFPIGTKVGTRMGIRLGYDILNNIRADVFVLANFNEGSIDARDAQGGALTGDLAHFAPGVALRFDFITSEDGRFFAYTRAGAGYAFWFPGQLAWDLDTRRAEAAKPQTQRATPPLGSVHTDVSLGVEYYTKLRHLSAGLEVDFQALFAPNAFGFQVYPTLKYTF
jgi:hypothetical protein